MRTAILVLIVLIGIMALTTSFFLLNKSGILMAPATCTDSDGGLNYFVKGVTAASSGSTTDQCLDNNILMEYSCPEISTTEIAKPTPLEDILTSEEPVLVKTEAEAESDLPTAVSPGFSPLQGSMPISGITANEVDCSTFGKVCADGACVLPQLLDAICGNGVIESGESCDDYDTESEDGCSSTCQIEMGWGCVGQPSICYLLCGNNQTDEGEQCDDGGICTCREGSSVSQCPPTFAPVYCTTNGSQCSLGSGYYCKTYSGDGCDENCQIEQPEVTCGNGIKESGEDCDDGNLENGDGCSSKCAFEPGFIQVCTPQNLSNVRNNLSGNYIQVCDMDLSGINFVPIGTIPAPFVGTYNGNNLIISDLNTSSSSQSINGLFGVISGNSMLTNMRLVNAKINGVASSGGLVGRMQGNSIIKKSSVEGRVYGHSSVGGLAGEMNDNSIVRNSNTQVNLLESGGSAGPSSKGGFVGAMNVNSTIYDSSASGSVTGGNRLGGFVGNMNGNHTIINSSASGAVTGGNDIGGFVGRMGDPDSGVAQQYNTIINSSASGTVNQTGSGVDVGGFVGEMNTYSFVYGSSASGNIFVSSNGGGFVGQMLASSQINNSSASGSVFGFGDSPYLGGFVGEMVDNTLIENSVSSGNSVTTVAIGHPVMGGFVGYMGATGGGSQGVKNCISNVVNVNTPQNAWAGGFVGIIGKGYIEGSSSTSNVNGPVNYLGGFVGKMSHGTSEQFTIKDSVASGKVNGLENVGGFVGRTEGANDVIINCIANGDVNGTINVGGFIGSIVSLFYNMSNVIATGDVSGIENVGGFTGSINPGTSGGHLSIYRAGARGNVLGNNSVGGFAGSVSNYQISIKECFATGNVNATGGAVLEGVGGFVGVIAEVLEGKITIKDSYAQGSVSADKNVGGFAGQAAVKPITTGSPELSYQYTYSSGHVQGNDMVGGFFGKVIATNLTINDSFWDSSTSGQGFGCGGNEPCPFKGLSSTPNCQGWDFQNIWTGDCGHPTLKWETSSCEQKCKSEGYTYGYCESADSPQSITCNNDFSGIFPVEHKCIVRVHEETCLPGLPGFLGKGCNAKGIEFFDFSGYCDATNEKACCCVDNSKGPNYDVCLDIGDKCSSCRTEGWYTASDNSLILADTCTLETSCNDGVDNNGDGTCDTNGCIINGIQLSSDLSCSQPLGTGYIESFTQKFAKDGGPVVGGCEPGCEPVPALPPAEGGSRPLAPQCNDTIDNDGDGLNNYPADPDCLNAKDNDETNYPELAPNCEPIVYNGDIANSLNIVFVPSAFGDALDPEFFSEVQSVWDGMKSKHDVYKAPKINIFLVREENLSINCGFHTPDTPQLLTCDNAVALQLSSVCTEGPRQTIVIHNTSQFGGSGGLVPVISRNYNKVYLGSHELAHNLFSLADETHGDFTPAAPNCDYGGCPKWQDIIGYSDWNVSCFGGKCANGQFWASEGSLMDGGQKFEETNERITCCVYRNNYGIEPDYCRKFDSVGMGLSAYCAPEGKLPFMPEGKQLNLPLKIILSKDKEGDWKLLEVQYLRSGGVYIPTKSEEMGKIAVSLTKADKTEKTFSFKDTELVEAPTKDGFVWAEVNRQTIAIILEYNDFETLKVVYPDSRDSKITKTTTSPLVLDKSRFFL
jgi:cysteine-rich repeat protein